MAIIQPSLILGATRSALTAVDVLSGAISAASGNHLRQLLQTLNAPSDAPGLRHVLHTVVNAIETYGRTLVCPNDQFAKLQLGLKTLLFETEQCRPEWDTVTSSAPMRRRLTKHAVWALCNAIHSQPDMTLESLAVGVEIAYSFATNKMFSNRFATEIRRSIELGPARTSTVGTDPSWRGHMNRVIHDAAQIFEGNPPYFPPTEDPSAQLARQLFNKAKFATAKHRQSILNQECQSSEQVRSSSYELRARAELGDPAALLTILAFLCGLPTSMTLLVPVLSADVLDWVITIDLDKGLILTDTDTVFRGAASTPRTVSHRPACRIIAKPLPTFMVGQLQDIRSRGNWPCKAYTVGDLLPQLADSGRSLTVSQPRAGIAPTESRFVRSSGRFCVSIGIDRLCASLITNDFAIIPPAKLYYCNVARDEIWKASHALFETLGWGPATDMVPGLPFGSRVVPTRESITEWYRWMKHTVMEVHPGKRYSINGLIKHHNAFARFCASMAMFSIGARRAAPLHFLASELAPGMTETLLDDKRAGENSRPLPVPINATLAQQIYYWFTHCRNLALRLEKLGFARNTNVLSTLSDVTSRRPVPLFFQIDLEDRVHPLGSGELMEWWPPQFGFSGNHGRHFWQTELFSAGLKSSSIDMFMRHQPTGAEAFVTTSNKIRAAIFEEIAQAQEKLLRELLIEPLSGIAKK